MNQEILCRISWYTKYSEAIEGSLVQQKQEENNNSLMNNLGQGAMIQNTYKMRKMDCMYSNRFQREKEFNKLMKTRLLELII